jgi:hypothetical protein
MTLAQRPHRAVHPSMQITREASSACTRLGRGADPQGQKQPAPPDDEQEQANIQALEARLSSSGNVNDAWALHNARKASRR